MGTVSVVIGCSYNPVAVDVNGVVRLSIGGNVIAHTNTFRIRLRGSYPDKMRAWMVSSPCYPQDDINFAIDEGGIVDIAGK